MDETTVLNLLKTDKKLIQKRIAESIKKSEKNVKMITASLQKKGLITRVNGKRFGFWKDNID